MSGRRYLTSAESLGALRRSGQIEQFVERYLAPDGRAAVRWLSAFRSGRSFNLVIHNVEDVGTDEFLDVYEFPPLDDDEHMGEGHPLASTDAAETLLLGAVGHGAQRDRWVNVGVVQDEYSESPGVPKRH